MTSSDEGKRITQKQLAELAGVSQGLVSAILGRSKRALRYTVATQRKVLLLAKQYGYPLPAELEDEPLPQVQKILWISPLSVGLPFMLVDWVQATCHAQGRDVLIDTVSIGLKMDREFREYSRALDSNVVHGVLCYCADQFQPVVDLVRERNWPLVALNEGPADVPLVSTDEYQAAKVLIDRLFEQGCRNFAYLYSPLGEPVHRWDRERIKHIDGYLKKLMLPPCQLVSYQDSDGLRKMWSSIEKMEIHPDAILGSPVSIANLRQYAYHQQSALGMHMWLGSFGVYAPLVNDERWLSVHFPSKEMVVQGLRMIDELAYGRPVENQLVPYNVVD